MAKMIRKQSGGVLFGKAKVSFGKKTVTVRHYSRPKDAKNDDDLVTQDFEFDKDEFFDALPKGVEELKTNTWYHCVLSADGSKVFQFRPLNVDEMTVRFKGFFEKDGNIMLNPGFKDKEVITAIAEFEVVEGEWKGVVYPYRWWPVTDRFSHEPVFQFNEDGILTSGYLSSPVEHVFELAGMFDNLPVAKKLTNEDDPQVVLEWIGNELKKRLPDMNAQMKDGYIDMTTLEPVPDSDSFKDDEEEEEEVPAPRKVSQRVSSRRDDDDDDTR